MIVDIKQVHMNRMYALLNLFSCLAQHSFLHCHTSYANLPVVTESTCIAHAVSVGCGVGNLRNQLCEIANMLGLRPMGC